jgi:hypothetical protein
MMIKLQALVFRKRDTFCRGQAHRFPEAPGPCPDSFVGCLALDRLEGGTVIADALGFEPLQAALDRGAERVEHERNRVECRLQLRHIIQDRLVIP